MKVDSNILGSTCSCMRIHYWFLTDLVLAIKYIFICCEEQILMSVPTCHAGRMMHTVSPLYTDALPVCPDVGGST